MLNYLLIILGKLISKTVKLLRLGDGSTWPGHIALKINKHFVSDLLNHSQIKTILIAGTNGKTTTASLIQTALAENGKTVIRNTSGANLANGIASTLLLNTNIFGKHTSDFAIFEVDENALPNILKETNPDYLLLLNLFRDQLDRYGEVNTIIGRWKTCLEKTTKTKLILNADDPQIANLGFAGAVLSNEVRDLKTNETSRTARNDNVSYFGLQDSQFTTNKLQHAADSVYCPKCGEKLIFDQFAFSHLGKWYCKKCGLKRPDVAPIGYTIYPMPGLYNKYNVLAATALLKKVGLTSQQINDAFTDFTPAFGRQEIIEYKNKNVQVFLSKNPTSFNQSYTTIKELGGKILLLVLNDRIPDGQDISWIWDIDLSDIASFKKIFIAGDRVYDMALRLQYESRSMNQESKVHIYEDLREAVEEGVKLVNENETLFILPTYSAMLETRKILTGKKIL